jgi:hypothetical protein
MHFETLCALPLHTGRGARDYEELVATPCSFDSHRFLRSDLAMARFTERRSHASEHLLERLAWRSNDYQPETALSHGSNLIIFLS